MNKHSRSPRPLAYWFLNHNDISQKSTSPQ